MILKSKTSTLSASQTSETSPFSLKLAATFVATAFTATAFTATTLTSNVYAETLANSETLIDSDVETMVVTANRTAISVDDTLASVTVVTRADIERSQVRTTEELLRNFANLTIRNSGGRGKQSSLFFRGTGSNHTLFLIDGIKVSSVNNGLTAFQNIPVDQIERVEIVRGPRSSLYGSEAVGGVVQIFTRKASESGFTPFARIGAGSDDTKEVAVGFGVRHDFGSFNAAYSYEDTDGIDAHEGNENDDDAFENSSLSLSSDINVTDTTRVSVNYLQSHTQNEFDDSFGFYSNQENKDTLRVLGAGVESQLTDVWSSSIDLGRSWEKSHSFANYQRTSTYETRRDSFSWLNELTPLESLSVIFGYDFQEDYSITTANFIQDERSNHGVFAQVKKDYAGHDVEVSYRYDDNEQFGSHETGAVAWGYSFENDTRLRASYGTAFVAPSFNFLYHPGYVFCCSGNPDLKPEKSETFEVGLDGSIDAFNWSMTVFRTDIKDLIISPAPTYVPDNVDEARIQGVELSANTVFFDWAIRGDLTMLSAKSRKGQYEGNRLVDRPKQTVTLMLDRTFGRFSAGATVLAESQSFDDQQNTVELPGYATLDLRVGYEVMDSLTVQAKVENLFEKEYQLSKNYNQAELTYLVSVSYQP